MRKSKNKLRSYIMQDFDDGKGLVHKFMGNKANQAVILYRLSSWFYMHKKNTIAILISNYSLAKTGADIAPEAEIGQGFKIGHPVGVVIGGKSRIGQKFYTQGGVVIGTRNHAIGDGNVVIKDNVEVGAGAKILGDIIIGNNVKIGANAVVLHSIHDNKTAVGIPAVER